LARFFAALVPRFAQNAGAELFSTEVTATGCDYTVRTERTLVILSEARHERSEESGNA